MAARIETATATIAADFVPMPLIERIEVVSHGCMVMEPADTAPSFAEFASSAGTPAVVASLNPCDGFDALAEMAAAQVPAVAIPAVAIAPAALHVIAGQCDDPGIIAMRNELTSMRQMIERQMGQFAIERLRGSPARAFAFETLQAYGCDESLAQTIASRIDSRLEPAKVKAPLLAELARMLTIVRAEPIEDGGVFALIGPTGAGKTTTLAKLAARFAQRHRARDVALVTTDIERPGAREQLHALGRRLGITVCEAEGPEGLTDALDQLVDYPLVLVDTAGYAARDKALLGQVTWLRATRGLRSLLVLPANLQAQDLSEAVRRYRMAQPEAVVLTKLDETGRLGAALSVAVRHGLPLAYTTAGQHVPADLEAADASRLVLHLEKLRRAADNPLATEDRHVVA
ncbi:MAG: flagellar biosynthesis protein FlhF [Lysobacter sp.]|nr:MAG: flagellar biosynthesis protein FlhF [Lysobacter sp.]